MRQVLVFLVLTFALSWGAWGVAILADNAADGWRVAGTFGPTVAALIVSRLSGPNGPGHPLSGLLRWRVPAWVWGVALFSTAALGLVALGIDILLGGTPEWPGADVLVLAPVIFAWVLVFSVAGEETGWRGYLLPRLLERKGPVGASLLLGLVWALWHLPLWAMPSDFHAAIPMPLFALQILAVSLLYSWLWLASKGSLVIAHVFHAAFNTTLGLLPLIPGAGGSGLRPLWIAVGLLCLVAAAVAVQLARGRTGTSQTG